ncbi:RNA methyltransferase, TrmH family [Verrucomicrobiia bacterium DG1235]|nr:RNA methyltransferase, TrmH family [Verrucomicrobiae bacterium DG1235]
MFRKFLLKKTRVEEGRFLIEGWHLVDEAVKSGRALHAVVFDPEAKREAAEDALLKRVSRMAEEVFEASGSQLSALSDTRSSQGVVALVSRVGMDFSELLKGLPEAGPARLLLLDEVGDPGNCGSMVRAADWFGLDGVVFGKGCAELENGKTSRATMGGLFYLPVAVGVDLAAAVSELRRSGVQVFTTELDESAVSLRDFEFPERCALVIGNEARGVSAAISELADGKLFVERFGSGESLNAAVAAAVFLGKWRLESGE